MQDITPTRAPARTVLLPVPMPRLSDDQVLTEVKRLKWEHARAFSDCQRANQDLNRAMTPSGREYAMQAVERYEAIACRVYDAWDAMRGEAKRRGLEVSA